MQIIFFLSNVKNRFLELLHFVGDYGQEDFQSDRIRRYWL